MDIDVVIILLVPAIFMAACLIVRQGFLKTRPLPDVRQVDTSRWVPWGCLLVLIVGSVFGHEFFNVKMGPLPITIDRIILGGLVILFARQFWMRRQQIQPLNRVDTAILIWLVAITISAVVHDYTILSNMPLSRLLFFNWLPVVIYFMIRWCRLDVRDLKIIAGALVAFGIYLTLTGIAETRGLSFLVFPRYIMESETREFLGRGRGPFLNPVSNGIFISMSVCCVLMWWPKSTRTRQGVVVGLALLMAFGVFSTLTRSTWLGLAAGLTIFVFWPSNSRQKGAMFMVATVAGIALFPIIIEKVVSFKRDAEVSQAEMEQSARLRPLFAAVAVDMFQDRPLMGVGFAQYAKAKYPYLQNPHSHLPLKSTRSLMQHNVFLAYLVDMGLLGLGLFLFLLGQFCRSAWSIWNNKRLDLPARQFGLAGLVLLCTYSINGLFHDVSIIPMVHTLLFFWFGIVNNIDSHHQNFSGGKSSPTVPLEPLQAPPMAA